jgi:hypothetical protein
MAATACWKRVAACTAGSWQEWGPPRSSYTGGRGQARRARGEGNSAAEVNPRYKERVANRVCRPSSPTGGAKPISANVMQPLADVKKSLRPNYAILRTKNPFSPEIWRDLGSLRRVCGVKGVGVTPTFGRD